MDPLHHLLQGSVKRAHIGRQLEASFIVETADHILKDLFPEQAGTEVKAMSFKNGTLTVSCVRSVIAQEIKLNQVKILDTLNGKLGSQVVKSIRYLL